MKKLLWFSLPVLLLAVLGDAEWLFSDSPSEVEPVVPMPHAASAARQIDQGSVLPLPLLSPPPAGKVALGERLFHDPRLSKDNTLSCAHCHPLAQGGMDRRRFSVGINGQVGSINAPTVFNAALNFAQFWDGRAPTLEAQALMPIENPLEMGSNVAEVLVKLKQDPSYQEAFLRWYPEEGVSARTLADAIASYERTLMTYNAPFDRYLGGVKQAISPEAQDGYRRFVDFGCASCHQGAGIGGNMFQRFGVMDDYFRDKPFRQADQGRYNVTGQESDRHVFKVPSLRNVAVTAPYFHDGSADSLKRAVEVMGRYQLGKTLTDEDVRLIVLFLQTLTGEWQGQSLR